MNIVYLIKDFIRLGNTQIFINRRFKDKYKSVVSFSEPDQRIVLDKIRAANDVARMGGIHEAYNIYMAVKKTLSVDGDIAEVGVYRGGSAKIICSIKGSKHLHLFDTFEGLPAVDEIDAKIFHKGQYAVSLEDVKSYLKNESNVSYYKGMFPNSIIGNKKIEDKKFSFVNLDVDIFESTKNCIHFFYPRMNKGGIIISHDYNGAPGVKKAFDEFFIDKPEPVIELSGSQCLIVKM